MSLGMPPAHLCEMPHVSWWIAAWGGQIVTRLTRGISTQQVSLQPTTQTLQSNWTSFWVGCVRGVQRAPNRMN